MKTLVLVVAFGVALSGCATVKKTEPQAAVVAPVAIAPPVRPVLQPARPGPWRITKTEWTKADEDGFGEFVREIAESGCTTTISCMQSAANFYHDSDPPNFVFRADCAKWAYMLRAYYASKNGLPFSYVSKLSSDTSDPRLSHASNLGLERHDMVDNGTGLDTVTELQAMHDAVWTATYRMDPAAQFSVPQDFYSPKLQPGSIHAGTVIYDINGHVVIVYDITADGSVLYMDANPDQSVTHGVYGAQIPRSEQSLGGGFKNFRPLKLVGAQLAADGTYVGGTIVLASNDAIADFSLEQYRGNAADTNNDDPNLQFRYNNVPLNLYEYVRASLSKGGFAFNPVYEISVTMGSLCRDAKEGTPGGDARFKSDFATLYADISQEAALWQKHDLRVLYHGNSLRESLAESYAAQDQACLVTDTRSRLPPRNPLEERVRYSPESNVQNLIAGIYDPSPIVAMQPVGK